MNGEAEERRDDHVVVLPPAANASPDGRLAQRAQYDLERLLRFEDRREPLVAEIATWIAQGVIEGRLRPGQDLNSVDLSNRFHTSRTPVREALMLLENEGLVEMRARRRPRVATFTLERIREIYTIRQNLLAVAGRLVAEHAPDAALVDLGARVAEMRVLADSGDVDGYFWAHVDLQERITELAGNQTLKDILDSLALRTLILRHRSLSKPGRLADSVQDQELILRSIRDRDPELTGLLLARATRAALRAIESQDLAPVGEVEEISTR